MNRLIRRRAAFGPDTAEMADIGFAFQTETYTSGGDDADAAQ